MNCARSTCGTASKADRGDAEAIRRLILRCQSSSSYSPPPTHEAEPDFSHYPLCIIRNAAHPIVAVPCIPRAFHYFTHYYTFSPDTASNMVG
jgi:hypothetical protein